MPLDTRTEGTFSSWTSLLTHPGSWHLRTRLVAIMMSLLALLCLLIAMISYSTISATINSQLDSQVNDAMQRSLKISVDEFSGTAPAQENGRPGIPGQVVVLLKSGVNLGARIYPSAADVPGLSALNLTSADLSAINKVSRAGLYDDAHLSIGDYRLQAVNLGNGLTVVTGLPRAATEQTLATLVITMVLVSLACLLLVGIVGTVVIRRNLRQLEELSSVAGRVAQLPLDAGEVALSVRAPASAVTPNTEVGNLGLAFNAMLENVSHALQSRQRSETKVRRFVADASHELRTPLTAIRGYTELLAMTEQLSDSGKTSLARVTAQSLRMSRLVEDLLTLARLDEGQPLALRTLDVSPLVMDAVSDVRVTSPDHQWEFEVPDTPVNVKGDDGQLKQVLLNLLSNAAKHTPPGTAVRTVVALDAQGDALLTVSDNGPGIEPSFLATIFDRFSRADVSRTGTQGSTGLGLSIVQAMVKAHGGTINVVSQPGATTFTVRLPGTQR